jgi:hypothetical protein
MMSALRSEDMRLYGPFPALLLFAFAIPIYGEVQPRPDIDSLLNAASKALERYQQVAPSIHCEDATKVELRDACKITVEGLGIRVQEAQAEIARYRQLSTPEPVDLFDAYEIFRRVMDPLVILDLTPEPELWGEHNQQLFAEVYNSFVKIVGWFGGVVRDTLHDVGKCGAPVSGIALCLSPGRGTLEVRNTGEKDAVLNLGTMVGNGTWQYPTAITLLLRDANGKQHRAKLAEPVGVIGGRLDALIVPLPRGASLKLPLDVSWSRPWYASGRLEDFKPDLKKHCALQAQFIGKGVSQAETNLDLKGLALMPFWTGAVASNIAAIGTN